MSKRKFSGLSDDLPNMDNGSKFDNLPKEIVAEIMSYVPPVSLMRCKCLNKSWHFFIRCLIKDVEFIVKHHSHAEASPTILLICEPSGIRQRLQKSIPAERISSMFVTPFIDKGDEDSFHCVMENISSSHLSSFLKKKTRGCSFNVYHCNGIICLTKDSETFGLYNPALSEFETFHPETGRVVRNYDILGMGFGSDSGASNFKIVRLLKSMKAEVFIPCATWREINVSIPDKQYLNVRDHVYFKGNCFWLAKANCFGWTVLCFDVCGEVFHDIPLPNELCTFGIISCCLTARNDSVCLFCFSPGEFFDMWLMEIHSDGGIGDFNYSWRNFLRIESRPKFYTPLEFWKGDELLVNGGTALYNLRTGKLRQRSVNEMFRVDGVFYFRPYVQSLVSVKKIMKRE